MNWVAVSNNLGKREREKRKEFFLCNEKLDLGTNTWVTFAVNEGRIVCAMDKFCFWWFLASNINITFINSTIKINAELD